jgi:hypothetical protein
MCVFKVLEVSLIVVIKGRSPMEVSLRVHQQKGKKLDFSGNSLSVFRTCRENTVT